MRIIDRKEFLELPAGTLFYLYEPAVATEFSIKGATHPSGNCYSAMPMDAGTHHAESVSTVLTYNAFERSGDYDDDQQYIVLEPQDLFNLKQVCDTAIKAWRKVPQLDSILGYEALSDSNKAVVDRHIELRGIPALQARLLRQSEEMELPPSIAIHYLVNDLVLEEL